MHSPTLPILIVDGPIGERVISVDGFWPQPGLNLSHWPGNTTPAELKRELSTGIALAFVKLPRARREVLASGCVALANNHYDTDGVCALFVLANPAAALTREAALLDAAAAGDLFRFPSERAFAIDCALNGLADPERSPLRAGFAGLDDRARRELATREAVRILPELLDGALEPYAELWKAPLARCLADRALLAASARDDLVHFDLTVFSATDPAFAPGRHAFFGSTPSDRVLLLRTTAAGTTARFVLNTTSWFDIPGRAQEARPDLAALARRLNELEGTRDSDALAWRAQPTDTASPELWFGRAKHPFFGEHNTALGESRIDPLILRAAVVEALRAVWVFPDDE